MEIETFWMVLDITTVSLKYMATAYMAFKLSSQNGCYKNISSDPFDDQTCTVAQSRFIDAPGNQNTASTPEGLHNLDSKIC